jgi:4-amino-4-deoxy-L-arabinose transferase-like glycosyltransferase
MSRRWLWVIVGIVLLTGLLLRLKGFSYPPFDSHRFRQTHTLSTIEAFHADGIDLLHPRAIHQGYPGVLVLEFPLFQALAATVYNLFGAHIELVRVLNILFGLGTLWLLWRITLHLLDETTALFATFIYWLSPLNILYQRSTLADPFAVFVSLLSFYCLALLLVPGDTESAPASRRRSWVCFGVFAMATVLAALLKVLYLWPAVLLLAQGAVRCRRSFNVWVVRATGVFGIAGVLFLLWNHYAASVNALSPITRGLHPTSLLGVSALFTSDFYVNQLLRRPLWWVGAVGLFLYPAGLVAGWLERAGKSRAESLCLLALIPPGYLLLFANINGPHNYYQLIITPFLAAVAGNGLRWLSFKTAAAMPRLARFAVPGFAAVLAVSAALTYLIWLREPRLQRPVRDFGRVCSGKVVAWEPAMLFVCASTIQSPPHRDVPEYLYVAKLWGYGETVSDAADAEADFEQMTPAFQRLRYVLFYGTEVPDWPAKKGFQLTIRDEVHRFYLFEKISPGLRFSQTMDGHR